MTAESFNYKLVIAYDGTQYSGWQIQPNSLSIQEIIQNALKTIRQEDISIIGSGRTDAGVHALGQVANFKTSRKIDLEKILYSLNSLLPKDIRILSIDFVPPQFHAQKSAISKTYHYNLTLGAVQNPFQRFYSFHISQKCDLQLLQQAAQLFIGTYDFTSFANEPNAGSVVKNPVRTIYELNVLQKNENISLQFTGNGFLYKMVRNIVGTMLEVSFGKRTFSEIPQILAAKDRKKAGQAAPPHGLFLMSVEYF